MNDRVTPPTQSVQALPNGEAELALVVHLPWEDVAYVSGLFLMLLTTCPERRMAEHEDARWWDFIGAERRSPAFRRYFADIAVRSLVAMCPRRANTRTIGTIGMQLWIDHARPGAEVDRLLDGPTQDVWITPWVEHLRRLGVRFEFGAASTARTGGSAACACRRRRGRSGSRPITTWRRCRSSACGRS